MLCTEGHCHHCRNAQPTQQLHLHSQHGLMDPHSATPAHRTTHTRQAGLTVDRELPSGVKNSLRSIQEVAALCDIALRINYVSVIGELTP